MGVLPSTQRVTGDFDEAGAPGRAPASEFLGLGCTFSSSLQKGPGPACMWRAGSLQPRTSMYACVASTCPQEIDQLCKEWSPEPLVPTVPEAERVEPAVITG